MIEVTLNYINQCLNHACVENKKCMRVNVCNYIKQCGGTLIDDYGHIPNTQTTMRASTCVKKKIAHVSNLNI